jgi:histone acetyltransferase 1
VDNVEATLSEFIPPGVPLPISSGVHFLKYPSGYETDEKTFLDIVERDATGFRPLGNKIYSYQRVSPSAQGKGKGVASATDLDPESEDVTEYEVYHVSTRFSRATSSFPSLTIRSVNMEHPGI